MDSVLETLDLQEVVEQTHSCRHGWRRRRRAGHGKRTIEAGTLTWRPLKFYVNPDPELSSPKRPERVLTFRSDDATILRPTSIPKFRRTSIFMCTVRASDSNCQSYFTRAIVFITISPKSWQLAINHLPNPSHDWAKLFSASAAVNERRSGDLNFSGRLYPSLSHELLSDCGPVTHMGLLRTSRSE